MIIQLVHACNIWEITAILWHGKIGETTDSFVFSYRSDIFNNLPLKEWQNPTDSAAWRFSGDGGSPYKPGFAPLRQLPGCHQPKYILLDYCHVFHLGYGQDMAASSIILLSQLGHFGNDRKLDNRLIAAYEKFDQWCHDTHRTSSIDEFSKQSFGMGSLVSIAPEHYMNSLHRWTNQSCVAGPINFCAIGSTW